MKWRFWKREKEKPAERKKYKIGGGWGDTIDWLDWDNRKVVGWKHRRPNKGDILVAEMGSGKTAAFEFMDVKYCGDPNDMFFAKLRDVGYSDEPKVVKLLAETKEEVDPLDEFMKLDGIGGIRFVG